MAYRRRRTRYSRGRSSYRTPRRRTYRRVSRRRSGARTQRLVIQVVGGGIGTGSAVAGQTLGKKAAMPVRARF